MKKRFEFLSNDLGVDLGSSNVLINMDGKGVIIREPAVVAVDKNTGKVLQVGSAARNMLGRTPGNVVAMYPMRDGVISDYEMTVKMLQILFRSITARTAGKPIDFCVPSAAVAAADRPEPVDIFADRIVAAERMGCPVDPSAVQEDILFRRQVHLTVSRIIYHRPLDHPAAVFGFPEFKPYAAPADRIHAERRNVQIRASENDAECHKCAFVPTRNIDHIAVGRVGNDLVQRRNDRFQIIFCNTLSSTAVVAA